MKRYSYAIIHNIDCTEPSEEIAWAKTY